MQIEIDDQTDDASESTEPVAPGTSGGKFCSPADPCEFGLSNLFSFLY